MTKADYSSLFNDKRLSHRGEDLLRSLYRSSSNSIQSLAETRAEQKGYYRFLNNSKVNEKALSDEMSLRCSYAVKNRIVLCIQDTTEINLVRHAGRLKTNSGLGPIDAVKKGIGFKIHPCLVVDAETCFPYGYAGIELFNRPGIQQMRYHRLRKLPVEQKESGKWLRGNDNVKQHLTNAQSVIIIQDREGDIYEQFTPEALAPNAHLLVRCKFNRYLENNDRLCDVLSNQTPLGTYVMYITSDSHKQASREALMEVRFAKVKFRRPERKMKGIAPYSQDVYVIEAKEITDAVKDPVHWRLITTCPVENLQSAKQVIDWYNCRWMIEEVFRVLKKECYNIEGSELEQGWAIRKLSIMILDTIIKLFQMLIVYNIEEGEPCLNSDIAFEKEEIECLQSINKKMQGNTEKLSNIYDVYKLKGAVWVIARLGGWKGYASQRKPGATTLIKGLQKFYNYYEGASLNRDVGTR